MARTTAPLFSLDASGTIANSIVFSKWRGRQYVRRHAVPKNPQTAPQVGIRAMMKFLAQDYQTWKTEIDANFALLAATANVSPFNSFVSVNMRRWRSFHAPSWQYPALEDPTSVTITQTLTAGPRSVTVYSLPSSGTAMWGVAIIRSSATIITPNWNLAVAIMPSTGGNPVTFTDAPLVPGEYHYRSAAIDQSGTFGVWCVDDSATATA